MTIVGLDDTDSREHGMCTTYVAAQVAQRLRREADATVDRTLLVRLNPAVEYKTRGNAALAIHTDCDPERAFDIAREVLESLAETRDERTNPGLVVADVDFALNVLDGAIPAPIARFSTRAIREHLSRAEAEALIDDHGYQSWRAGNGRGRIGALAAIGAWRALSDWDWTYEQISYREPERWGTPREVDHESVFAAADAGYPDVWDTVDRGENETVCVPHTPGPILHGIRGDDPEAVRRVATQIDSEPVYSSHLFVTNQGTDVHLRDVTAGTDSDSGAHGTDTGAATATPLQDGRAYRLDARVVSEPETRRGGHVFVDVAPEGVAIGDADGTRRSPPTLPCAAFEPTKRFRDHVRALRPGDRLTVCGELADGTLKLEKVAVRGLDTTDLVTPICPDCERTMESAGRDQGYRCRDCGTDAPGKERTEIERVLELGWYEVPPCARRHIAKPLVRGGFDGPVHPER